eukprot:gene10134-2553_t
MSNVKKLLGMNSSSSKNDSDDEEIVEDILEDTKRQNLKILLLGSGDSGKSTFLHQLKMMNNINLTQIEIENYKKLIRQHGLNGIQQILEDMKASKILLHNEKLNKTADKLAKKVKQKKLTEIDDEILTPDFGKELSELWKEMTLESRENTIESSFLYFVSKIEDISKENFTPTNEDILYCRKKSVGVHEQYYSYSNYKFLYCDVGGQQSERRKWAHVFDDCNVVLFITSLNSFDQTLVEDEKINRLEDSLALFEEICALKYLQNSQIYLILNKYDLFKEKIKKIELHEYFNEYNGKNEEEALNFIKNEFLKKNMNTKRDIETYTTTAIDSSSMKDTLFEIQEKIIQKLEKK